MVPKEYTNTLCRRWCAMRVGMLLQGPSTMVFDIPPKISTPPPDLTSSHSSLWTRSTCCRYALRECVCGPVRARVCVRVGARAYKLAGDTGLEETLPGLEETPPTGGPEINHSL